MRLLFGLQLCLTFILWSFATGIEEPCSGCKCKNDLMDCTYQDLKILPKILQVKKSINKISLEGNHIAHITEFKKLESIEYLSLSHNRIFKIDDSAFRNLRNLSTLDLSYNYLAADRLMPQVFQGNYAPDTYEPLRNLKNLILDGNDLHVLNPDIFQHIPYLESLSLSNNPLKTLDFGTINALSSIPYLKVLNLSMTELKSLPDHFMHTPKFLEILDLSENHFSEVPMELENTHSIKWISLSANPISVIRKFPSLPHLQVLHLNQMKALYKIENQSLNSLVNLEEFHCTDNHRLVDINGSAFSSPGAQNQEEGETWPPLRVLDLNNNALRYLDSHLIGRWDKLEKIGLENNSLTCDCENQWILSVLIPRVKILNPDSLAFIKCGNPVEMEGSLLVDLYRRNYQMRCLDAFNHRPEKDGRLLIFILIIVLFTIPIAMMATFYYNNILHRHRRYEKALFSPMDDLS